MEKRAFHDEDSDESLAELFVEGIHFPGDGELTLSRWTIGGSDLNDSTMSRKRSFVHT
jgi:hypothetical protein